MLKKRKNKLEVTDYIIKQVETMAGLGLSSEQISLILGINERTLRQYKTDMPLLDTAYKKGKAIGVKRATEYLFDLMEKRDRTSIIFFLKTQGRWRETDRLEITGADGEAIQIKQVQDLLYNVQKMRRERTKQSLN